MKQLILISGCLLLSLSAQGQKADAHSREQEPIRAAAHPESMLFLQNYLQQTEQQLLMFLDSLTTEKLNYQPAQTAWSVKQIFEHIIAAENVVFSQVRQALANDNQEVESLKHQDAWLISKINDRGKKVKTPLPLEESQKSIETLMAEFKQSREDIRSFLAQPSLPLRTHYGRSPYGKADCYQLMLVIAAHSMRHFHQIVENIEHFESPQ